MNVDIDGYWRSVDVQSINQLINHKKHTDGEKEEILWPK